MSYTIIQRNTMKVNRKKTICLFFCFAFIINPKGSIFSYSDHVHFPSDKGTGFRLSVNQINQNVFDWRVGTKRTIINQAIYCIKNSKSINKRTIFKNQGINCKWYSFTISVSVYFWEGAINGYMGDALAVEIRKHNLVSIGIKDCISVNNSVIKSMRMIQDLEVHKYPQINKIAQCLEVRSGIGFPLIGFQEVGDIKKIIPAVIESCISDDIIINFVDFNCVILGDSIFARNKSRSAIGGDPDSVVFYISNYRSARDSVGQLLRNAQIGDEDWDKNFIQIKVTKLCGITDHL